MRSSHLFVLSVAMGLSLTLGSQFVASTVTVSVKCANAIVKYQQCIQKTYGSCNGKTGSALLTCLVTGFQTGGSCNAQSLTPCLSPECNATVTAFTSCVQTLQQSCKGKTGSALQACVQSLDINTQGCNLASVNSCLTSMGKTVGSASGKSTASGRSAASGRK